MCPAPYLFIALAAIVIVIAIVWIKKMRDAIAKNSVIKNSPSTKPIQDYIHQPSQTGIYSRILSGLAVCVLGFVIFAKDPMWGSLFLIIGVFATLSFHYKIKIAQDAIYHLTWYTFYQWRKLADLNQIKSFKITLTDVEVFKKNSYQLHCYDGNNKRLFYIWFDDDDRIAQELLQRGIKQIPDKLLGN